MDDNLHVLERLVEALHELVTNAGRVQERLFEALPCLHRIRPDDFLAGKLRTRFLGIKDDLAFEPKYEHRSAYTTPRRARSIEVVNGRQ